MARWQCECCRALIHPCAPHARPAHRTSYHTTVHVCKDHGRAPHLLLGDHTKSTVPSGSAHTDHRETGGGGTWPDGVSNFTPSHTTVTSGEKLRAGPLTSTHWSNASAHAISHRRHTMPTTQPSPTAPLSAPCTQHVYGSQEGKTGPRTKEGVPRWGRQRDDELHSAVAHLQDNHAGRRRGQEEAHTPATQCVIEGGGRESGWGGADRPSGRTQAPFHTTANTAGGGARAQAPRQTQCSAANLRTCGERRWRHGVPRCHQAAAVLIQAPRGQHGRGELCWRRERCHWLVGCNKALNGHVGRGGAVGEPREASSHLA